MDEDSSFFIKYFYVILTGLYLCRLNSVKFAGIVVHDPVNRAKDKDNSHTQQLFILFFIRKNKEKEELLYDPRLNISHCPLSLLSPHHSLCTPF